VDDGIVKIENGKCEVTDKIYSAEIPATINEVLLARIDKLEYHTKSLLKIASVIGRNFFYKILIEIAKETEEIDNRLNYLEQIQLLKKHKRLQELEYFFRHALAHEATYESILLKKRKQLHLKVAVVIESIFLARIHEFYGMLALHYSKGEDLDKAEEYLLKAGEEAVRISASSEAIYNFKEALSIYMKKYGSDADPEKIIMMEKNIAFAYHNKGQFSEALKYFDRILIYYNIKSPKNSISKALVALNGLIHLLVGLYWPSIKWKKIPNKHDAEIIKINFVMLNEIGVAAPERLISKTFDFYKRLTKFDLTRIEEGVGLFSGASVLFSLSGISFTLSRKVVSFVKNLVNRNDIRSSMYFEFAKILGIYLSGRFQNYTAIDRNLVNSCYRIGEALYTTYYVTMHVLSNLEFGNFKVVTDLLKILDEIGEKFDHHYAKGVRYFALAKLFMKYGDLEMANIISDQDINFLTRIDDVTHLPRSYALRAEIQIRMGDIAGAEKSLATIKKFNVAMPVPLYTYEYYLSSFIFDVYQIQKYSDINDSHSIANIKKIAKRSGKKAINMSRKVAPCQPEVFKQMGLYYWLIGHPKMAIKWWSKAIKVAEQQGARINLSSIYHEVGKRLSKENNEYKLNGFDGIEYLERSKKIFQEIDAQWNFTEFKKSLENQYHSD
jgi:tetratricopeptide (TPR) repeat protein